LIFIATVFLTYFTVFQIHFALLPKSGTGDAFMTPAFRQGKLNPFEKFMELNMTKHSSLQQQMVHLASYDKTNFLLVGDG